MVQYVIFVMKGLLELLEEFGNFVYLSLCGLLLT